MKVKRERSRRGLLLAGVFFAMCLSFAASGASAQSGSYTNPVSEDFADTFADPAIIKAKDGYWYAFGTTDPLREGEGEARTAPISRSENLTDWEYVGDAFEDPSEVSWAADDASIWAPDIRYMDGEYYMYYVVTQTDDEAGARDDSAIGVATAPTPSGPWKDSGEPVVAPREGNGGFLWTFDPTAFVDEDGTRYLYYGSYNGGMYVTELSDDGTRAVGEPEMVAIDNRYEGAYVIKHDDFYYLFASSANCCAGPTTGYSVYVGRSESPKGPFLDKEGQSMTESRVGGSIVVTPNGNEWVGPGHNAVVTDLSGEDFFVYHAIDRADPYLDGTSGINERPMLIDRLDWIGGWPTVRGGAWASNGPETSPVTDWIAGSDFNDRRALDGWRKEGGAWRLGEGEQEGGYVRRQDRAPKDSFLVSRKKAPANVRAEGDFRLSESLKPMGPPTGRPGQTGRGAVGLVVAYKGERDHIVAWLDPAKNSLVTDAVVRGRSSGRVSTPLPNNFTFDEWHNVAAEIRGREMTVEVTDARLNDPLAVQNRTLPREAVGEGSVGVASRGSGAEADNVGAAKLYEPNTEVAPTPEVGDVDPAFSDEFDDGSLEPEWSLVREPDGEETNGSYVWPTQNKDLTGQSNDASVLLRDAPEGEYTVETKLSIDLGTDTVRNFQQGGLVAYVNDDEFLRLSHVAIFNTRQTEFGKEMPYAGGLAYGGMLIGPPAETTWLRLSHRTDPENGEHEFRAATSRDGENWVWGGVWTLPVETEPRIGVISHGGDEPQATSEFDYFRVSKP